MRQTHTLLLFGCFFICLFPVLQAQSLNDNNIWTTVEAEQIPPSGQRMILAENGQTFQLDIQALRALLDQAPMEFSAMAQTTHTYLPIPMPDGSMELFDIVESPIMAPELAEKFPEINTYAGYSTTDPSKYLRFDFTPQGFHAMVLQAGGETVFIDPYTFGGGDIEHYIVYYRKDFMPAVAKNFSCGVTAYRPSKGKGKAPNLKSAFGTCELRTYRLALACTGEYAQYHGGTVAGAQAAQVTTMNRVNGIYEREMAIRMNIIGNNNLVIYTNGNTDPYTNNSGGAMLGENVTNLSNVIGNNNFDIGHVFSTGGGGVAGLGVVCTNSKARGVTGSGNPVGDPFDVDYVAHEMGHQFGANHTQNNGCNRNGSTAMEPGSASTIMGYAGICNPNVQTNSDDYFHSISLQEIGAEIQTHTCPVTTTLTNTEPIAAAPAASVTIPASTPFFLTATATDPDPDVLTYCWEQMDNQVATMPPVATSTGGPNFRSLDPDLSPTRYFPNLTDLAAGGPFTWEVLSSVSRTMNFRVTVRDNATGGGCTDHDDMTVTVDGNSGPFEVVYPSATGITWTGNTNETVTWNVNGTDQAPVSCSNVDILLSTDGGQTYTMVLANTPNDGTQAILVPNTPSTTCRIMVRCAGGYFFDISNNNFTIVGASNDYTLTVTSDTAAVCPPASASYTINVGVIGTFTNAVTLSVTGVPAGATSTFSTNPVTPVGTSTLTINNTGSAAPGVYNLTLTANSTSGTKTIPLVLIISDPTPSAVTLTSPTDGATGISSNANFSWSAVTGTGVSYFIEISTSPTFGTIAESATVPTNSYTATTLSGGTTYYWRVTAQNACGSAPVSSVFSFTTSNCTVYNSANVPVAISASGTPTVTSTVPVGAVGTITDVNVVNLQGTHTYISDLTFTLSHPGGTDVVLFDQVCANENDFDVKFDDAAAPGALPCPPVGGGTYQPDGTLSSFNGLLANGTWTLTIDDNANQDGGSLNAWGIEVCVQPPVTEDASVSAIINPPNSPICANPFTPEVTLSNVGTTTLTSATINYQIDAGTVQTFNWTGSLASGASTNVVLNPITSPTVGTPITFTAYSSNPNGLVDGNPSNDTSSVVTQIDQPQALPYAEGFNAGLPTDIQIANPDGDVPQWDTTNTANSGAGTASIWINNFDDDTRGTIDAFILPTFDLTGMANVQMTFDVAYAQYDGTFNDTLLVGVNNNCGTNYTPIWNKGGTDLATAPDNTNLFIPSGTQWRNDTVDLSAYDGQANVRVAFINQGGWGNGLYIDNINIIGTSTCSLTPSISSQTNVSCNGGTDGAATAAATGGTAPYTYAWSSGGTAATETGLAAGVYTVTVSDAGSCVRTESVTITEPASLAASTNSTAVNCNGGADGSATVTATGGTTPYSYAWSSGGNAATETNLTAGTYTVTITDDNGCVTTETVNVTEPATALSGTTSSTDVSCFNGSDGTATVVAAGGTAPYSYVWGGVGTTATVTGLFFGNYTVTITDANGCTSVETILVDQPISAVVGSSTSTDVNCFGGSDGTAMLSGSGGTPPYSYVWPSGNTAATETNLVAGNYFATVLDANGCSVVVLVTINEPGSALATTISSTGESCVGNDGSASVSPSGGTAPYSYAWSTGGNTATLNNLAAGSYTVTISDDNGCTLVRSVVVSNVCNPCSVGTSSASTDVSCFGVCDGTINITTSSGTAPYTYTWGDGATGASRSGLCAGTYEVTVIDNAGCNGTESVTITEPAALTASASNSSTACVANSGTATATAAGGTAPYNYAWSSGGTAATETGLTDGTYTVTITDDNGCSTTASTTIAPIPVAGTASVTTNDATCGAVNGNATANMTGGLAPFAYSWSNGETSQTINSLSAGTYTVTITDDNGCTTTASATVVDNGPVMVDTTKVVMASSSSANDGSIDIEISGGTAPYTYNWSNGATTQDITGLAPGTYSVTITDVNGCTVNITQLVVNVTAVVDIENIQNFQVFPNPNTGEFMIDVQLSDFEEVRVELVDVLGRVLRNWNYSQQRYIRIPVDISDQAGGMYMVVLRTENGQVQTLKVSVAR